MDTIPPMGVEEAPPEPIPKKLGKKKPAAAPAPTLPQLVLGFTAPISVAP
jgi:hypothetical protein